MAADAKILSPALHFPPILTNVGEGASFSMLGTTMRLIATGADSGGRFTVGEQVTPVGWGPPRHIHSHGRGVDPTQLAQDKDFLGMSPQDQMGYLSSQDPDFAKMLDSLN